MSNFGILQKLDLPKQIRGKKVLDAGCGSGFFLFDYLFYGADVTGIDQSENSIEFVRQQANALGFRPTLIACDLETVSLPDNSFDYIFCTYVLHHTPNPLRTFSFRELSLPYFVLFRNFQKLYRPALKNGFTGRTVMNILIGGKCQNNKLLIFACHRDLRYVLFKYTDSQYFC